jgi:hypothetical protein
MALGSRLKKLQTIVATRGNGRHPTVIQLELRHQRFFLDSAGVIPPDFWEPLDSGEPGSLRRSAFDLACEYDEVRIWQKAERAGLTQALEDFLGRGPLTPEELVAAEEEFFHPLTSEEFYAKVAAERADELRQEVSAMADAAGEPPPPWLDRLQDDLTAEEAEEIEAWPAAHLQAEQVDTPPSVDSEGLSVPRSNDTTQALG